MFPSEETSREDRLIEGAGQMAAAQCAWLLELAGLDAYPSADLSEFASTAAWLSWSCGVQSQLAKEYVLVARALRGLPKITEEFSRGRLSYSQVRLVVRVATEPTEQTLIYIARNCSIAQLAHVVGVYRSVLEAEADERARHRRRALHTWFDADGFFVLRGRFCPEAGALVDAALRRAMESLPQAESAEAEDPYGARQADALVCVVRQNAQTPTGKSPGPEIVVYTHLETLAGSAGDSSLGNGVALAPSTALRLSCDAALVALIEDWEGTPLSVGRRARTIPVGMRRALSARDRGCRFPGCLHTRYLDGHHVKHWAHGGETRLDNLLELCSFHHRLVHEGGYSVKPCDSGFEFFRSDGSVVSTVKTFTADFTPESWPPSPVEPHAICSEWLGDRLNMQYVIGALVEPQSHGP